MENITLAFALLLGIGFVVAKAGQLLRLPSVTGYICAGLLLGPSGLDLLSYEKIGDQFGHFTQIALMMISFGIGEHLEIKRLHSSAKSVAVTALLETFGAFTLVASGTFLVAVVTGIGPHGWGVSEYMVLAILFGAVSVATAPATTMHVMQEVKAAGPLTTRLMAVVAFDNGLAIMIFGIAIAAAHQLVTVGSGSFVSTVSASIFEIVGSLGLGFFTGLVIDFTNNRLRRKGEMLIHIDL